VKTVDAGTRARLLNIRGWRGFNNPWMPPVDEEDMDFSYINLQQNQERYTGYKVRQIGMRCCMYWPFRISPCSSTGSDTPATR